jgi:hypothetical protein
MKRSLDRFGSQAKGPASLPKRDWTVGTGTMPQTRPSKATGGSLSLPAPDIQCDFPRGVEWKNYGHCFIDAEIEHSTFAP